MALFEFEILVNSIKRKWNFVASVDLPAGIFTMQLLVSEMTYLVLFFHPMIKNLEKIISVVDVEEDPSNSTLYSRSCSQMYLSIKGERNYLFLMETHNFYIHSR